MLFQCGEFYEIFFDDAVTASAVLGITLTARGSRAPTLAVPDSGDTAVASGHARIPMCGFPVFAADTHIARLVQAGHAVVVCDQVEVRPRRLQAAAVRWVADLTAR